MLFPRYPLSPLGPVGPVGPVTATLVPLVPIDPVMFNATLAVLTELIAIAEKLAMNEPVAARLALTALAIELTGMLCG